MELFAAILFAVFVHELSHLAAMLLIGLKIKGIHFDLSGMRIDYVGSLSIWQDCIAAAAGPLGGLIYYMAVKNSAGFLYTSGQFSLIYTVFNLLPVLVLDGGRIFYALTELLFPGDVGEEISETVSFITAVLLFCAGLYFMLSGEGNGLFAAGVWLLILQS